MLGGGVVVVVLLLVVVGVVVGGVVVGGVVVGGVVVAAVAAAVVVAEEPVGLLVAGHHAALGRDWFYPDIHTCSGYGSRANDRCLDEQPNCEHVPHLASASFPIPGGYRIAQRVLEKPSVKHQ